MFIPQVKKVKYSNEAVFLFIIVYCNSYHKLCFFFNTNKGATVSASIQVKECFVFLICKRILNFLWITLPNSMCKSLLGVLKGSFLRLLCISISLSCREQQKENAIIQICMLTLLNCSCLQYIPQRCKKEGSPLDSMWAACLMHFSKDREVYHWYSGPVVAWAACYKSPV